MNELYDFWFYDPEAEIESKRSQDWRETDQCEYCYNWFLPDELNKMETNAWDRFYCGKCYQMILEDQGDE